LYERQGGVVSACKNGSAVSFCGKVFLGLSQNNMCVAFPDTDYSSRKKVKAAGAARMPAPILFIPPCTNTVLIA